MGCYWCFHLGDKIYSLLTEIKTLMLVAFVPEMQNNLGVMKKCCSTHKELRQLFKTNDPFQLTHEIESYVGVVVRCMGIYLEIHILHMVLNRGDIHLRGLEMGTQRKYSSSN